MSVHNAYGAATVHGHWQSLGMSSFDVQAASECLVGQRAGVLLRCAYGCLH